MTSLMGGAADTRWTYQSLLLPIRLHQSGCPKDRLFTFVRDGLESAVAQAKAAAGDKDVGVIGANLVQQCIKAGLLDEIHLDMVPVVLGGGVGLFDHLGTGPIELERTRVIEGAGVTHLTFRVV